MSRIVNTFKSFRDDEEGAALVEYTILIGIIAVAVIGTIVLVGEWMGEKWEGLKTGLEIEG